MMKTVSQNVARQLKQLGGDIFETAGKQPGEMADKALEQMDVGGKPQAGQPQGPAQDQLVELEKKKAEDKARSQQLVTQIVKELETEIAKWRKIREERLRQRRQQLPQQTVATAEAAAVPLQEPILKPKRGLFGFWGRRAKRAQEQAQPETAGRRVGG